MSSVALVLFVLSSSSILQLSSAVSCNCGSDSIQVPPSTFGANGPCFNPNINTVSVCSQIRTLLFPNGQEQIETRCRNALVGVRNVTCDSYYLIPDADGVSLDVTMCNFASVSFSTCSAPVTAGAQVWVISSLQPTDPGQLYTSNSQCLNAACPETPANATGDPQRDRFLTTRNGISYSLCNKASTLSNICDASSGTCTCQTFFDGTQALTGQACQFDKGRDGTCCFDEDHLVVPCCITPPALGACFTLPTIRMCGIFGQSRSARCISPDGVSPPACATIQANSTGPPVVIGNCPLGLSCPSNFVCTKNCAPSYTPTCLSSPLQCPFGDTTCLTSPFNSVTTPFPIPLAANQPCCACQVSLCGNTVATDCTVDISSPHGVCFPPTDTPFPECHCQIPPQPCLTQLGQPNSCTPFSPTAVCGGIASLGGAPDMCGGVKCNIVANGCRTQTTCDTTILWETDVPHPCVCNGNGLCNFTTNSCACFSGFDQQTRCSGISSCEHCNTNAAVFPPPSNCSQTPGIPSSFQCMCSAQWYTIGSFQNTPLTRPVYQCSASLCVGCFLPNGTTHLTPNNTDQLCASVDPHDDSCTCPLYTVLRRNSQAGNHFTCCIPGAYWSGQECGFGNLTGAEGFIETLCLPPLVLQFNPLAPNPPGGPPPIPSPIIPPVTNFTRWATCNCDGFNNADNQPLSWIRNANGSCETYCLNGATFFLKVVNGVSTRTCTNCNAVGFSGPRCELNNCLHGSVWNADTGRCDCIVYPYDYDYPGDTFCALSRCDTYCGMAGCGQFDSMTNLCVCPVGVFNVSAPPVGNETFPANMPGCVSLCMNGGSPNPATGYTTCLCPTFGAGILCQSTSCVNGHVVIQPGGNRTCVCDSVLYGGISCNTSLCDPTTSVPVPPPPTSTHCTCIDNIFAGNIYCSQDLCVAYQDPTTNRVILRPPINIIQKSATNITVVQAPSGFAQCETLACTAYDCSCTYGSGSPTGFSLGPVTITPMSGPPFTLQSCSIPQCKDDQDVVVPVPQTMPASFSCRCQCPPFLAAHPPPLHNNLYGCTSTLVCVHPSTASLATPGCSGYVLNATNGITWVCSCAPGYVGLQCNTLKCDPQRSQYNPMTDHCVCTGHWSSPDNCDVCSLTGDPPSNLNNATCSCVSPTSVLVGSVCVNANITCVGITCPVPIPVLPPIPPPVPDAPGGQNLGPGMIALITILSVIGAAAIAVLTWYLVTTYCPPGTLTTAAPTPVPTEEGGEAASVPAEQAPDTAAGEEAAAGGEQEGVVDSAIPDESQSLIPETMTATDTPPIMSVAPSGRRRLRLGGRGWWGRKKKG